MAELEQLPIHIKMKEEENKLSFSKISTIKKKQTRNLA